MNRLKEIFLSKDFIKYFLIIFIPLVLLFVSVNHFLDKTEKEKLLVAIKSSESSSLLHYTKLISNQFEIISTDLAILSESRAIRNFVKNETKNSQINVEQLFLSVSKRKKIYDQIRFIDTEGKEKIRVNFKDGKTSLVATKLLQDKHDRYYFKNTIKLDKEKIYISPFDLNIENEKIEDPRKPVIRFGIPVFDSNHKKQGVIILNYLGENLLNTFSTHKVLTASQTMLLNEDGYWLYNKNKENEWGFMYANKQNRKIQLGCPECWEKIYNSKKGQFYNKNGLVTYTTIYPLKEIHNIFGEATVNTQLAETYFWKFVLLYPQDSILLHYLENSQNNIAIRIAIFLILISISILIARVRVLRKEADAKEKEMQEATKKSEIRFKKLNSDKDKFFSIISHDLRSPFNGIMGIVSLLKNEIENLTKNEIEEAVTLLDNSVNGVYNLLNGLLEWSRVQTGRIEFEPEVIELAEKCNCVTALMKTNASAKNISIINTIGADIRVLADKNMLNTILRNLVSNAIKFSRGNGIIKYSAIVEETTTTVTVADSGIGMSEEDKEKLFRIDIHHTTVGTQNESGTGVGLILCKELVEKNGGKIWVESEVRKGSQFSFTLPNG